MDRFWLLKTLKSINKVSSNCNRLITDGKLTPLQKEQITKAYLEMKLKLDQLEMVIKENETMMEKFNELYEEEKYLILRKYMPDLPLRSYMYDVFSYAGRNLSLLARIEEAERKCPKARYFVENKKTFEIFAYSNLTECVEDFIQDKKAFVKYLEEHPEIFK